MKFNMPSVKQVLNVISKIIVGLLTFYLVAGFFIIPAGIKGFVNAKVPSIIDHFVYVEKVTFNPILFRLNIYGLDVAENEGQRLIGVDHLHLDFSFFSLFQKKYRIQALEITGLYLHPVISKEGNLNFLKLIPSSTVDEKNITVKEDADPKEPPVFLLDHFLLSNSVIHVEDQTIDHPFNHSFRPINLKVEGLSTAINENSDIAVVLHVAQTGKVLVNGTLQVKPLQLTMNIDVEQVPLRSFQPYVHNFSHVSIENGNFNLQGKLVYDSLRTSGESLSFTGDMNCEQFQLRDLMTKDPLLSWNIFEVKDIQFLLDQKKVDIDQILFDQLQGRFVLEESGLNINRVVEKNKNKSEKFPDKEEVLSEEIIANDELTKEKSFEFNLNQFLFHKGVLIFVDQTTEPNFTTELKNIEIDVTGISTRPDSEVQLTFTGSINEDGNLEVNAKTFPLAKPLDLDLGFQLKNLSMVPLTPYVGKFTGLGVEDGDLNLDIDYEITKDNLLAKHDLIINKFNFGQKFESDDALKLPFRMATSLLKDVKGDITIDLPVKGNISDPKFQYVHLLGKTFTNFLLKVVTKPFTFLASVIGAEGGEEEFSYINFIPGESILTALEQEKIVKISKALQERPALDIEIRGVFDPDVDWLAIKTQVFQKEYAARLKEYTWSNDRVLEEYYKKIFGLPEYRKLVKTFRRTHDGKFQVPDFYVELKRQLIENAPADKAALQMLANDRAEAIRYAFVDNGGLNEERISIKASTEVKATDQGAIALELTLIAKE